MAPTRVRGKDIAWQYLKHFSSKIPGIRTLESELAIELPGTQGRVTIYGADNDRAMGLYLDGIIYDECDEIPPTVHTDIVRPALSDRNGWAVWMGILRGRHNLFKRFETAKADPGYYSLMLRASESGIVPAEELASMRADMGESAYLLQMECDVNQSLASAIFGMQMDEIRRQNRIRPMNADPTVPLYTFWDIGHSDQGDDWTLWAAQFVGADILLVDYHARTGQPPAYYAAKVREWEDTHKVRVAMNYLPHDGARRNQVGKTAVDYLKDAGLDRIKVVPRTPNLWDSINLVRAKVLPRAHINQAACSVTWRLGEIEMPSGIDCLDYYSKKEDVSTGIIMDVPVHNQYSHGADALRTLAEAYRQGMIEGTSFVARDHRHDTMRVLRGPSADSYSIKPRRGVQVIR